MSTAAPADPGWTRSGSYESAVAVACRGLILALNVVSSLALARAFGPRGKGALALLAVLISVTALVSQLSIQVAVVHFGGRAPARIPGVTRTALRVGVVLGTAGALAAALVLRVLLLSRIPIAGRTMTTFVPLAIPCVVLVAFLEAALSAARRTLEAIALDVVGAATFAALALIIVVGRMSLSLGIGSLVITAVVPLAVGLVVAKRHGLLVDQESVPWKPLARFGLRGHAGAVAWALTYRIDVLFVAVLASTAVAGIYSVAQALAQVLWVLPFALLVLVASRAASLPLDTSARSTALACRLTLSLSVVAAALLAVGAPAVVRLCFGPSFAAAALQIRILLLGIVPMGLGILLESDLGARGHPGVRSRVGLVGLAVTLTLDLTLIGRFGATGAAVASVCAYATGTALYVRAFSSITGVPALALLVPRAGDLGALRRMPRATLEHFRRP